MRKKFGNRGFTLLELIVVLAILVIVSFIAVPVVLGFQSKSAEQVCKTNRQTLLEQYQIYTVENGSIGFPDYYLLISGELADFRCPDGGTFQCTGSGITAKVTCSIHDKKEEVTEPPIDPTIIPDTNGIPVNNTWPTGATTGGVSKSPGSTYYYEGSHYIQLYPEWIAYGSDPSAYKNVVKISTGPALNIDDWVPVGGSCELLSHFNAKYGVDLKRGDKVTYKGKYYICIGEPMEGMGTKLDPNLYMGIPPNHPWYELK